MSASNPQLHGSVSQESGKPPQAPTISAQSRCDKDKPPEMIPSFSTKARSGTPICQKPIPHSEEAEKIGTPYHKEPKRYVGKHTLWGPRFFEAEESIEGKIERALEGKGEVLVRKIEVHACTGCRGQGRRGI